MAGENAPGLAVFFPIKLKDCTINWVLKWVHTDKLAEHNTVPEESSFYSVGNVFCGSKHLGVLCHLGEAKTDIRYFLSSKQEEDWINLPLRDYSVVNSLLILERFKHIY